MNNNKAYFLDNEYTVLYELSATKRKQLEKKHPNWLDYDCEKTPNELLEVYHFFKENGKILAHPKQRNIFSGFVA